MLFRSRNEPVANTYWLASKCVSSSLSVVMAVSLSSSKKPLFTVSLFKITAPCCPRKPRSLFSMRMPGTDGGMVATHSMGVSTAFRSKVDIVMGQSQHGRQQDEVETLAESVDFAGRIGHVLRFVAHGSCVRLNNRAFEIGRASCRERV